MQEAPSASAEGTRDPDDLLIDQLQRLWPEAQLQARDLLVRSAHKLASPLHEHRIHLVDLLAVAYLMGARDAVGVAANMATRTDETDAGAALKAIFQTPAQVGLGVDDKGYPRGVGTVDGETTKDRAERRARLLQSPSDVVSVIGRAGVDRCQHGEPIRFAAQNLLKPEADRDEDYCWCCGTWLAGARVRRCVACIEGSSNVSG